MLLCSQIVFSSDSDGKESACSVGDLGSIPGLGGSPGEGNGNPLQYLCLENPMDGGAWWATVHGVADSDMTEQLTYTQKHLVPQWPFDFSCRKYKHIG